MPENKITKLEALCGQDVGRNIFALVAATRGELYRAARSIAEHPNPHIAILTGLYIVTATPPSAETDGPVGAVQMAAAFSNADIPTRLFIDPYAAAPLVAARACGCPNVPLTIIEQNHQAVEELKQEFLNADPPVSHVIAIERMSPSRNGKPYSMRVRDLSAFVAPVHEIFEDADRPWQTIGIGDGGNEMGMGKIPFEIVRENITDGETTASRVASDHLIVGGLSNWAATALVRSIALLRPDLATALMEPITLERERAILEASVTKGGAVDGVLQIPQASVDGVLWPKYSAVMQEMLLV